MNVSTFALLLLPCTKLPRRQRAIRMKQTLELRIMIQNCCKTTTCYSSTVLSCHLQKVKIPITCLLTIGLISKQRYWWSKISDNSPSTVDARSELSIVLSTVIAIPALRALFSGISAHVLLSSALFGNGGKVDSPGERKRVTIVEKWRFIWSRLQPECYS